MIVAVLVVLTAYVQAAPKPGLFGELLADIVIGEEVREGYGGYGGYGDYGYGGYDGGYGGYPGGFGGYGGYPGGFEGYGGYPGGYGYGGW